jgi:hypothetical protein
MTKKTKPVFSAQDEDYEHIQNFVKENQCSEDEAVNIVRGLKQLCRTIVREHLEKKLGQDEGSF